MSKSKILTPEDLDPATLKHLELLWRQRERIARTLRKRRRAKSGQ